MRQLAIAGVLLVGCGGGGAGGGTPPVTPVTAVTDCMKIARSASTLVAGDRSDVERGNLEAIVTRRCTDDAWSADAKACLVAATTSEMMHGCVDARLTGQQKERVMTAAMAVLGDPSGRGQDDPPPPPEEDKPEDGDDESGGTGTAMALDEGKMGKKDRQVDLAEESDQQGRAQLAAKDFERAAASFRDAVSRVPEPAYFYDLCVALAGSGKVQEATVACQAALKTNPSPSIKAQVDTELRSLKH